MLGDIGPFLLSRVLAADRIGAVVRALGVELGVGQAVHGGGAAHAAGVEAHDVVGLEQIVGEVALGALHQVDARAPRPAGVDEQGSDAGAARRAALESELDSGAAGFVVIQRHAHACAGEGPGTGVGIGLLHAALLATGIPVDVLVVERLELCRCGNRIIGDCGCGRHRGATAAGRHRHGRHEGGGRRKSATGTGTHTQSAHTSSLTVLIRA